MISVFFTVYIPLLNDDSAAQTSRWGMWVLEGDEVVAVNGTNVEGKSLDEVRLGKLVASWAVLKHRFG